MSIKIDINDFALFVGQGISTVGIPYLVITNNKDEERMDFYVERSLFVPKTGYCDTLRVDYKDLVSEMGEPEAVDFAVNFAYENARGQMMSYLIGLAEERGDKGLYFQQVEFRDLSKRDFKAHMLSNDKIHEFLNKCATRCSSESLENYAREFLHFKTKITIRALKDPLR